MKCTKLICGYTRKVMVFANPVTICYEVHRTCSTYLYHTITNSCSANGGLLECVCDCLPIALW